jgi:hypothetical protein
LWRSDQPSVRSIGPDDGERIGSGEKREGCKRRFGSRWRNSYQQVIVGKHVVLVWRCGGALGALGWRLRPVS